MRKSLDKFYFFFVVSSFSGAIGRLGELSGGGDSNPLLYFLNLLFAVVTVYLLISHLSLFKRLLMGNRALVTLYMLAAVSLIWSVDPVATFRSCAYLFLAATSAIYLCLRYSRQQFIELLAKSIVILGILSVPMEYLFPGDRIAPGWYGIFLDKNSLGSAMAIGIGALLLATRISRPFRILGGALCVVMLVLSQSVTALLSGIGIVIIYKMATLTGRSRRLVIAIAAFAFLILSVSIQSLEDLAFSSLDRDSTLTGRSSVWAFVIERFLKRPIQGYGFGAFWSDQASSAKQFLNNWNPGQAHNSYLDIAINLGLVGLALVLWMYVSCMKRAFRTRTVSNDPTEIWTLMVIGGTLIHSWAEADFLQGTVMWFVFITAYMMLWVSKTFPINYQQVASRSDGYAYVR